MAQTTTHTGSLSSLTSPSSPGLRFLASFIPTIDALSPPPSTTTLSPFLTPIATFTFNDGPPQLLESILPKFASRGENLSAFRHDIKKVWDITGRNGKRTVLYESVSITVFKKDAEGKEVETAEFNVLELEEMEGGVEGLGVVESRTYVDASAIVKRVGELNRK